MATIREELILVDRFSKIFSSYTRQAEKAASVTTRTQNALKKLEAATRLPTSGVDRLTNSLKRMGAMFISFQALQNFVTLTDTLSQTTARIDMMNDGLQTTEELTKSIYSAAQRARSSYTGMADMVGKLGNLAGNAFSSSQELVAFSEQLYKQIQLSGASAMSADAAILQLTQGLSSGALRGEELNSVLEQTPMVAKTIADYLGVSIGEMRNLASEGALTADVVKNALLSAADETNAKFAQMPMTISQVLTQFKNYAIQAFQPVFQQIQDGLNSPQFQVFAQNVAQTITQLAGYASQAISFIGNTINWIGENWNTIQPILSGIVAGLIAWKIATMAVAAAHAILTIVTSPLLLVIFIISAIVGAIVWWIASVGGLQAAIAIAKDFILTAFDYIKIGIFTAVFWILNLLDSMALGFQAAGVAVANFMGDMKANVLMILQNMVNGAIDLINAFIEQINKISPVSFDAIGHVTFGTTAALENAAQKAARNAGLAGKAGSNAASQAAREAALQGMWSDLKANQAARQEEIEKLQHAGESGGEDSPSWNDWWNDNPFDSEYNFTGGESGLGGTVGDIGGSVGGSLGSDVADIKKAANMSEEDLKMLVDMAERQYVNNINLTAQTPVIQVSGQNTGNTKEDRKALANAIRDILIEQAASASVRSTARVY